MLNEQIKLLRMQKGLSQVDLAKELGVTKQSISNWENDNIQPSVEMLIKIAKFFKVPTDFLLGLSSDTVLKADGLTDVQIIHIQSIINDLKDINL